MKTVVCTCGNRIAVPDREIKAIVCSKCGSWFVNLFCGKHGETLRGKNKVVDRTI
jgi:hypothetical protein